MIKLLTLPVRQIGTLQSVGSGFEPGRPTALTCRFTQPLIKNHDVGHTWDKPTPWHLFGEALSVAVGSWGDAGAGSSVSAACDLVARLVDQARAEGVESVGENGLPGRPTKLVPESALEDEISVPRDRDGSFDPKIVRKRQRRLSGVAEMVISPAVKGLAIGEISAHLAEIYGAEVSKQRDGQVANRPVYVAMAVTVDGERDILGLWAGGGGEAAKFWLHVLTEIKNRGVGDALMVACDGLKGLPQTIESTPLASAGTPSPKPSSPSTPAPTEAAALERFLESGAAGIRRS
ncbi:transposase [Nonomuraea angiospora]|uniref:Mutator family transposase n=1 Tax=Nonomuraea angiospora TaxID=46172 RepID=A0ABR9LU68_9ACTN|nr:hypothetical protein [Nonomuraea angiospora]